jgi:hypothetical protein
VSGDVAPSQKTILNDRLTYYRSKAEGASVPETRERCRKRYEETKAELAALEEAEKPDEPCDEDYMKEISS